MFRFPVALALGTAVLVSVEATAEPRGTPVPAAPSQIVNTTTLYWQERPAVAALKGPGAGHVVIWESKRYLRSGTVQRSLGLFGQRYNAADGKVGPEFRVSPEAAPTALYPVAAGLQGGGFVVAWMGTDGWREGIFSQLFDASGLPIGSATLVNTRIERAQIWPRVAALGNGGYVIVWQSNHEPMSAFREMEVRAQLFSPTGAKVGGEIAVNTTPRLFCCSDVAALDGGGFVVVWPSYDVQNPISRFFGQRFDDTGAPLGGEFPVNDNAIEASRPRVVGVPNGGFMVVWAKAENSQTTVFAQRFGASGAAGALTEIADVAGYSVVFPPEMARLSNDELVVTWDGQGGNRFAQRLTHGGRKIGGSTVVGGTTTTYHVLAGLAEPTAPFVVAHTGHDANERGILAQRMRISGAPVAKPDSAQTTTATPVRIDPLANDTDPNRGSGDPRLITAASALDGTVTVIANGKQLLYRPGTSCAATDVISYTMQGSQGTTASSVVNVTISPEPILAANPAGPLVLIGPVGGPFQPATQRLNVRNRGCAPLEWTGAIQFESLSGSWINAQIVAGSTPLAPGDTARIAIEPSVAANTLAAGTYSATIHLTNASNGRGDATRAITLTVEPAD